MKNNFKISTLLPASPERIYKAWLNSKEHSAFTGNTAKATSRKGGAFSAWDNYIIGKNIELVPFKRIVQSLRSTDFPVNVADSHLELLLEKSNKGTKLTLIHSNIPEGQADSYKQGWKDFYFKPMKKYFSKSE
ncbi:MAG: SRPBCC domain-containing protein [Bacteroidetes bacterium]|nr:SRPBCC domain-containing protein [Bacteroidota bacterium]